MDVRTYRASTMHHALTLVRRELGPDAAVLHTREVRARRLFGLFSGPRQIEVTASAEVNVPSRFPDRPEPAGVAGVAGVAGGVDVAGTTSPKGSTVAASARPAGFEVQSDVRGQLSNLQGMLESLCQQSRIGGPGDLPESLFHVFTDLIEADLSEETARELIERVRAEAPVAELADPVLVKARIGRIVETEIPVAGPIRITPGKRRLVALVGPTGVGKTTTIAKLAANYRLKEKLRVGLITVDTYRIAAVEQLRTYADIIDLPMEVVSTPREMRDAVRRLEGLDLVLMDTAGRSPRDDIKIQELRTFLSEAEADEVHLVLSSVAGARTLEQTAERFAAVGTTTLILTKLDEATGLGNLLPLLRRGGIPLSYSTNGQNVPDDIETANARRLARLVLNMDSPSG